MKRPPSMWSLETLGRVRLSTHFFMRDFLYSEIGNFHAIQNIPDDPDLAIDRGRRFCAALLDPLQETFDSMEITDNLLDKPQTDSVTIDAQTGTIRFMSDVINLINEEIRRDMLDRARAAGYRIVHAPDLQVSHPSRSDWPALERKWRRITRESFGVNGNGARARLKWALRALAMLLAGEEPGASVIVPPTLITQADLNDQDIKNMEELSAKLPQFAHADVAMPDWMPNPNE